MISPGFRGICLSSKSAIIHYNDFSPPTSNRSEAQDTAERTDITVDKPDNGRLETTLGDLIAAAGEVAFEYSDNEKDAYNLARLALIEILRKTAHPNDLNKDFAEMPSPSQLIH